MQDGAELAELLSRWGGPLRRPPVEYADDDVPVIEIADDADEVADEPMVEHGVIAPALPKRRPPPPRPIAGIPAEFLGLARARIAGLASYSRELGALIAAIHRPLGQRADRGRAYKLDELLHAARRWAALPSAGRLDSGAEVDRIHKTLNCWELRIGSGSFAMAEWRHSQPAALLTAVQLKAVRNRAETRSHALALVSQRALARFYQYAFNTSEAGLYSALMPIAQDFEALLESSRVAPNHHWHCATPEGGRWEGEACRHAGGVMLEAATYYGG